LGEAGRGQLAHPLTIPVPLQIGVICNNSHLRDGEVIGSATEGALLVAAAKAQMLDRRASFPRTYEIPFSSEQGWMAVRCRQAGKSVESFYVKASKPIRPAHAHAHEPPTRPAVLCQVLR